MSLRCCRLLSGCLIIKVCDSAGTELWLIVIEAVGVTHASALYSCSRLSVEDALSLPIYMSIWPRHIGNAWGSPTPCSHIDAYRTIKRLLHDGIERAWWLPKTIGQLIDSFVLSVWCEKCPMTPTSFTSLFSLYPKCHRPMRKIHVESFYIHYHWKRNYIHV